MLFSLTATRFSTRNLPKPYVFSGQKLVTEINTVTNSFEECILKVIGIGLRY